MGSVKGSSEGTGSEGAIRRPRGHMGLEGCGKELVYIWFGAPSPSPPPASRFLTLVRRLFAGSSPALPRLFPGTGWGGVSRTRSRGICDCTGAPRASPRAVDPFSKDLRLSGGVSSRDLRLHGFPRVSWRSGPRGICDCPEGLLEGFATARVPQGFLEAWSSRDLRLSGGVSSRDLRLYGSPRGFWRAPGELLEAWFSRDLRLSGGSPRGICDCPGLLGGLLESLLESSWRPGSRGICDCPGLLGGLLESSWRLEPPGNLPEAPGEKRLSVKTWKMLIRVRES